MNVEILPDRKGMIREVISRLNRLMDLVYWIVHQIMKKQKTTEVNYFVKSVGVNALSRVTQQLLTASIRLRV